MSVDQLVFQYLQLCLVASHFGTKDVYLWVLLPTSNVISVASKVINTVLAFFGRLRAPVSTILTLSFKN